MTARQATIHRHRPRTITRRQETLFAIVLALLGLLATAFFVLHFDDFRFAFAEWDKVTEVDAVDGLDEALQAPAD